MKTHTPYTVVRSDRKTIALIIERDRSLLVRAPRGATPEQIERAVASKGLWIHEKTTRGRKYPLKPAQKEVVAGETLLYLGRHYQLHLVDEEVEGVCFCGGRFLVARDKKLEAGRLLSDWYREKARRRLTICARRYARAMGVIFNELKVSDLRYRWGSCTLGDNLNFNWRLVKAPAFVIDYLVVHELAHLLEPNHTPRFWNIIAVQVPDYLKAKEWLRLYGDLLESGFPDAPLKALSLQA